METRALSVADVVAIAVGLANIASMILGGVVVWWRVSVSDRLILHSLKDVQDRLRRIEDRALMPRGNI